MLCTIFVWSMIERTKSQIERTREKKPRNNNNNNNMIMAQMDTKNSAHSQFHDILVYVHTRITHTYVPVHVQSTACNMKCGYEWEWEWKRMSNMQVVHCWPFCFQFWMCDSLVSALLEGELLLYVVLLLYMSNIYPCVHVRVYYYICVCFFQFVLLPSYTRFVCVFCRLIHTLFGYSHGHIFLFLASFGRVTT